MLGVQSIELSISVEVQEEKAFSLDACSETAPKLRIRDSSQNAKQREVLSEVILGIVHESAHRPDKCQDHQKAMDLKAANNLNLWKQMPKTGNGASGALKTRLQRMNRG